MCAAMSAGSISDELDARLSLALDPFEDMCGPKSQTSIPAFKVTDLSWSPCDGVPAEARKCDRAWIMQYEHLRR